ncbi:hypothetical protein ABS768_06740 [Flavobacterium sp. ST-75]|uniref:Uncharacterized protein n=1 Tax=Flavobacterium rhizophilum TaxID=3163296 RepID=A0ABW8YAF3_9FLAO
MFIAVTFTVFQIKDLGAYSKMANFYKKFYYHIAHHLFAQLGILNYPYIAFIIKSMLIMHIEI